MARDFVDSGEVTIESVDHVVAVNEYGFLCLPTEYLHRDIAQTLNAGQVYEAETLRFLRRFVGKGDVITGGAFVGDFLPALAEVTAPKARIYSFEPVPTSFAAAEETIRLNGLRDVKISPVAVGAEPGYGEMLIARPGGKKIAAGERIITPEDITEKHETLRVPIETLDAMLPKSRKVSLVHLDVEGHETPALYGAARILNDSKPLVVLESGKDWRCRKHERVLNEIAPKAGYRWAGRIEGNAVFRPE